MKKTKRVGSFLDSGRIGYVTKWDKFKNKMSDKKIRAIMVGYAENNTSDT